jgi:hypothetical protein
MDSGIDPAEKVKAELQVEILALRHQIGLPRSSANRFVRYDSGP